MDMSPRLRLLLACGIIRQAPDHHATARRPHADWDLFNGGRLEYCATFMHALEGRGHWVVRRIEEPPDPSRHIVFRGELTERQALEKLVELACTD
jgi:hypothetical protein